MCSHYGDSNEYTQHNIVNTKKKIVLNYIKSVAMGFSRRTQERVRNSPVVKEPSVFEPLKFHCIMQ